MLHLHLVGDENNRVLGIALAAENTKCSVVHPSVCHSQDTANKTSTDQRANKRQTGQHASTSSATIFSLLYFYSVPGVDDVILGCAQRVYAQAGEQQ